MKKDRYITLTRDQPNNTLWQSELASAGYKVYELPCIKTSAAPLSAKITNIINQISTYDWLIFTSSAGVNYFKALIDTLGIDINTIESIPVAVVGEQTAIAAKRLELRVTFMPSRADSMSLSRELPNVDACKILCLRANIAPHEPVQILLSRSAQVTDLAIYTTELICTPDPIFTALLKEQQIGAIVFASPSALAGFKAQINQPAHFKLAQSLPVVAIGPHIAAELATAGFRNIKIATQPNVAGIIAQLS